MSEPFSPAESDRTQREQQEHIDDLIEANVQSNKTMANLVARVREETAARDRKVEALEKGHRQVQVITILVTVLILVLMALGIFNAVNLRNTRDAARSAQETNRTLLDCVNASGACGQANAANQANILNTVKQYELTVIYCARTNPQTVDPSGDRFLKCVNVLYPGGPQLPRR